MSSGYEIIRLTDRGDEAVVAGLVGDGSSSCARIDAACAFTSEWADRHREAIDAKVLGEESFPELLSALRTYEVGEAGSQVLETLRSNGVLDIIPVEEAGLKSEPIAAAVQWTVLDGGLQYEYGSDTARVPNEILHPSATVILHGPDHTSAMVDAHLLPLEDGQVSVIAQLADEAAHIDIQTQF